MADVLNTDYAEGLVLPMEDESKIRQDWLETFQYEGPRQRVCYELKEFASVCPFSGLPDTGIVWVEYIPCLLYTSPSPRDGSISRMPSSA